MYWFQKQDDADCLQHVRNSLKRLEKLEAEYAQLESQLEKLQREGEQKWERYQQFIETYDQFCRAYIGAGAKLDGAQGKAMKNIITYLAKQAKTQDEEGALLAWKFILANWSKLTKFIQNQTSLIQINKNLPEILTQLRRGKDKQAAQQNTTQGTRQRIIERRNSGTDHHNDQQP